MTAVAVAPLARLGLDQVRAATFTVPVVTLAEVIVTPAGKVSNNVMFVAVSGPRLVRMTV